MFYYKAFGLKMCSDIQLLQLPAIEKTETDIKIKLGCVPDSFDGLLYIDNQWIKIKENEVIFRVENIASYYVKNGNFIIVEIDKEIKEIDIPLVQVYLMGTAVGALLIQRDKIPLHGSCVKTLSGNTILFTGKSGAGKSTIASYFLRQGGELLSDDVTPVVIENEEVIVYPSFPQQKLWDDRMSSQAKGNGLSKLLYQEDTRQKFAVYSDESFCDTKQYLNVVFQLIPKEQNEITYKEIKGIEKAILIRENTYRNFLYANHEAKQKHFQMCAVIAEKLKIYQIYRPIGKETENQIYEIVNRILETQK